MIPPLSCRPCFTRIRLSAGAGRFFFTLPAVVDDFAAFPIAVILRFFCGWALLWSPGLSVPKSSTFLFLDLGCFTLLDFLILAAPEGSSSATTVSRSLATDFLASTGSGGGGGADFFAQTRPVGPVADFLPLTSALFAGLLPSLVMFFKTVVVAGFRKAP